MYHLIFASNSPKPFLDFNDFSNVPFFTSEMFGSASPQHSFLFLTTRDPKVGRLRVVFFIKTAWAGFLTWTTWHSMERETAAAKKELNNSNIFASLTGLFNLTNWMS